MNKENPPSILSTAYLGPVEYYSRIIHSSDILIESFEHFPKQTFRNRCNIYGANGSLTLTVPLKKHVKNTIAKDIKISYDAPWQHQHWRSIQSAYRCSPFFEFYEDNLMPFYNRNFIFLMDFNETLQNAIINSLKIKVKIKNTEIYLKEYTDRVDYRTHISIKKTGNQDNAFVPLPYWQVFQNKHGFLPDLSIIDLLFNQGPSAMDYIL